MKSNQFDYEYYFHTVKAPGRYLTKTKTPSY